MTAMTEVLPVVVVRRAALREQTLDALAGLDRDDFARAVLAFARDEHFRAALVASSWSFLRDLTSLEPRRDKRTRHAVQTALRYLTRTAKKVSPFGRFTVIELGELGDLSELSESERVAPPSSWIELNKAFVTPLTTRAGTSAAEKRRGLRWNPTLVVHDGRAVFLRRSDAGFVLQALDPRIGSRLDLSLTAEEWLAREVGDDAPKVARRLLEAGVIEWDARAPHASALLAFAREIPEAEIAAGAGRRFGSSSSADVRCQAVTRARAVLDAVTKNVSDVPDTDLFVEDRFGGVAHGFDRARIERFAGDAERLCRTALALDRREVDDGFDAWIAARFGTRATPLLTVFEAFAHELAEGRFEELSTHPPSARPRDATPDIAGALHADGDHHRLALDVPAIDPEDVPSLGFWLAIGASTALSAAGPGFGRGFGRFLRGAPRSVVDLLRARNRALASAFSLFELSPAPEMSADVHPAIGLPVLMMPGVVRDTALRDGDLLRMKALHVVLGEGGRAELHDRERGRLRLVDLRLTSAPPNRFERRVRRLAGFRPFAVDAVLDEARRMASRSTQGVVMSPRICGPSGLVFARRRWQIPHERLAGAPYLTLASDLALPRAHFAALRGGLPSSRSSHKPRYVNLDLPDTVDDLVRTARRARASLVVEEALPASGIAVEDGTFAAELYVERSRSG